MLSLIISENLSFYTLKRDNITVVFTNEFTFPVSSWFVVKLNFETLFMFRKHDIIDESINLLIDYLRLNCIMLSDRNLMNGISTQIIGVIFIVVLVLNDMMSKFTNQRSSSCCRNPFMKWFNHKTWNFKKFLFLKIMWVPRKFKTDVSSSFDNNPLLLFCWFFGS